MIFTKFIEPNKEFNIPSLYRQWVYTDGILQVVFKLVNQVRISKNNTVKSPRLLVFRFLVMVSENIVVSKTEFSCYT